MTPPAKQSDGATSPACPFAAPDHSKYSSVSTFLLHYASQHRQGWLFAWLSHTRVEITLFLYTFLTSLALLCSGIYFLHLSELLQQTAPLLSDNKHLAESAWETAGLAILLFVLIPLLGLFSALTRKLFVLRITCLAQHLERLAHGDYSTRVHFSGSQYSLLYQKLGNLINHLAETLAHQEQRIDKTLQGLQDSRAKVEAAYQAKSIFLANMSHELRTPLHGILSFATFGIRKSNSASPEKLLHYFTQIQNSGQRLLELLNDLLDLAKMESGRMRYQFAEVNLRQIIEEVLTSQEAWFEEKRLQIQIKEQTDSFLVHCDGTRMAQVVRNLLNNASKFSPAEQRIEIILSSEQLASGRRATDTALQAALGITIRDYGMGIPENELEGIFDKFVQSSKTKSSLGGTGLGLAICQEIVLAHRGKIFAQSGLEQGAAVTFIIPLAQPGGDCATVTESV
ncbi:sensor histidine kinase [Candidatus Magnetaquicoccus inordinatus]|uniref:sensor histidine kinase n=1 Tax=Candidatus Magnetaquicoccus inordinatus TaxID=2496818 RepID=UPI00102AAF95|nr:HAMP domain-containing sensor histidine kinase [Candidatus Magnetaquicoccus inordinatus]